MAELRWLPGGLRVALAPNPHAQSFACAFVFGAGSLLERPAEAGVSHFLEHMMFKGTRSMPQAQLISDAIEGVGGRFNASTGPEATSFYARVPFEHRLRAIAVLSDILTDSLFDEAEFERERKVIIEEIRMYQDQPDEICDALLARLIFGNHPAGRDVAGTVRSVSRLQRDQLVSYMSRFYHRHNLVIGCSGNFDPDQVMLELEQHIGQLPGAGETPDWSAQPRQLPAPRHQHRRRTTNQLTFELGGRAFSVLDADRDPLNLLVATMGQGMSSRLHMEVRERRGLCYAVGMDSSLWHSTGLFAVDLGCDPGRGPEALQVVRHELERAAEERMSDPELDRVRAFCSGALRLGLESTGTLAHWMARRTLLFNRLFTIEDSVRSLEAVSAEQVRLVAERLLASPLQLASVGPASAGAALAKAFEQGRLV